MPDTWVACAERSTERYEVEINVGTSSELADQKYRYRVRAGSIDPVRPWWNGLPDTWHHPYTSRVSKELNHLWMRNNPELAVDSILRFQEEHPITEWAHRVDMSLRGFMKLIAIRREQVLTKEQYFADGGPFLKEVGYGE